jgi:hypothetical protein
MASAQKEGGRLESIISTLALEFNPWIVRSAVPLFDWV